MAKAFYSVAVQPQVRNIFCTRQGKKPREKPPEAQQEGDPARICCPPVKYPANGRQSVAFLTHGRERHGFAPYRGMETKSMTHEQNSPETNHVKTLPVVVLVMLILAFIGLQAYYVISTIMTP